MQCSWHGVFPAAVTHFRDDESLDLPATLRHLDAMLAAGVHGLIMLGTVGENCSLEDEPRCVAIKESSDNVRRITDLKNLCGDRYLLFCGVDDLVLEAVLLGASGWVSGLVNAFPAENRLLWDLMTSGRREEAIKV